MLKTMAEQAQTKPILIADHPDDSRLPHGEGNLTPLAQLKRMQRVLFEMTQGPGIDRREAAQCACAWERLQARKAAMTMKPAPKPIDTTDLQRERERRRAERQAAGTASNWRKPKVQAPAAVVDHPMPTPAPEAPQP